MVLIKSYAKHPLNNYLEYLMMIQSGNWNVVHDSFSKELQLQDFDWLISHNLNKKTLDIVDGLYKLRCSYDVTRYVYVKVKNKKIVNLFLDIEQLNNILYFIQIEEYKNAIYFDCLSNHFQTSNLDDSEFEKLSFEFDKKKLINWENYDFLTNK